MRLLSRLLIILVICFVALALPAAPAQAQGAEIILSPDDGVPGTEVRVRGNNFTADEWVDIYYDGTWVDDVMTDGDGDFPWVTFEVPESHKGNRQVLAEDEHGISAYDYFTVEPGLTIEPEEGPVGTMVTVEGHGFDKDEEDIELRYYLNGDDYETVAENIEADKDGWWEVSFKIPPSTKGNHYIDAQGDDSIFAKVEDATFEVTPEISMDKSSGSVGESITMTGIGFAANERDITILFEGQAVATLIRADDTGYWEGDFEVPEMPKGTYSVTAEGERTLKEDVSELSFEIGPGLVLSPDEGHVGMNLTVTGGGFDTDEYVDVMYAGSQIETVKTNDEGGFEVIFPVPESKHGARQVTANVGGEVEAAAIFIMESDPPDKPDLVSPPEGDRVGSIGKVRPTFEWSEVSDDSGVYYSLQIATSANVTTTGGFADPVVSKQGLVGTNYTLEKAEGLSYGTYYWIVQAVDGAENESGWTAARSFRAGVMPLWAFIVIIVAVVVGIGAAVYFYIIRRRIYYY
jgi:hypothetical protein